MLGEQRVDFTAKFSIFAASRVKKRRPIRNRAINRRLDDFLDLQPAFTVHIAMEEQFPGATTFSPIANRVRRLPATRSRLPPLLQRSCRRSSAARTLYPCGGR